MSFRIGVDGGGTKTELILVDPAGNVVERRTAPGCNPSQAGPEAARQILRDALAGLRGGRAIAHTLLCMAGSPAFWRETADGLADFGRVTTTTDSMPVIEVALGRGPGLVLHAGTGSFVGARGADGKVQVAGALGWKIGDPGSAFDVGRRAIAAGLLELQGWSLPTPLGAALREHFGRADAPELTRHLYLEAAGHARIALFAPRVMALAAEGCAPAVAAVTGSVADLVAQGRLVAVRLFAGTRPRCAVSGKLLNAPPAAAALRHAAAEQAWEADFFFVTDPPVEGVRRLLLAAG